METKNLIPAPIDNKNIMEWFTESFHDNDCIESLNDKVIVQVFFYEGCLCEISYRFGQNWFKFRIIEGTPDSIQRCNKGVASKIKGMNDCDTSCVKYNPVRDIYEFYFIMED